MHRNRPFGGKYTTTVTTAFFATLLLGAVITWPLPGHFLTGIASSHRPETGGSRMMIAGDHLQLMYYFQLMAEFLSGTTPWMTNLYEFNAGDDAAAFAPDFYYAPFSIFYAAAAALGGQAAGWNFTGFLSLWATVLGTWLLIRRFRPPWWIAVAATAAGTLLPYRWITLLQGSPTGFAMCYVPFIMLGLDIAIRDKRIGGGLLAGMALLLSGWADTHTFFFAALLAPCWCLLVYLYQCPKLNRRSILQTAWALSGFAGCAVVILLQIFFIRHMLGTSDIVQSRTLHEVLIFSPAASGFLNRDPGNHHNLIYVTYSVIGMILLAAGFQLATLASRRTLRTVWQTTLFLGLLAGIGIILLLALGPRMSPAGPVWWDRLGRVFPPYAMIRQPAKIFSILPPLMAVLIVLPFAAWRPKHSHALGVLFLGLTAFLWVETSGRIEPTVSILEPDNAAYAAIRQSAEQRGETPRALAVVLWPGDTHWSSLYQYYAIKYRIRMVNGYRPNVATDYIETVFQRFVGLNQGYVPDHKLDALLDMGVRHLVLHEDAFPEKPSPFGVGQTLKRFLQHPRLRLIARDRAVWAFEISVHPDSANVTAADWQVACPTMVWDLARFQNATFTVIEQVDDALGGRHVRFQADDHGLAWDAYPTFARETLRLSLRSKGNGALAAIFTVNGLDTAWHEVEVNSDHWTWTDIPFPDFEGLADSIVIRLDWIRGRVDLDTATMLEGPTTERLAVNESFFVPATALFHAGYTLLSDQTVLFDPQWVPGDEVLYGPRLALPQGQYTVTLHYRAPGSGTILGHLRIREPANTGPMEPIPVPAGKSVAAFTFEQLSNQPVVVAFRYNRSGEMAVKGLEFTRTQ